MGYITICNTNKSPSLMVPIKNIEELVDFWEKCELNDMDFIEVIKYQHKGLI